MCRELQSIQLVLELLEEDSKANGNALAIPESLRKQINGIVVNCSRVVHDVEACIKTHEGDKLRKKLQWASRGKQVMEQLKATLEAHKTSLDLSLNMVEL